MSKLLRTIESYGKNILINKLEDLTHGLTLYGRARDGKEEAAKMQELLSYLDPEITNHASGEEMTYFHPNGSPKKRGEHYFHHIHIAADSFEEKVEILTELNKLGYVSGEMLFSFKERSYDDIKD